MRTHFTLAFICLFCLRALSQFGPGVLISDQLALAESDRRLMTADLDMDGDIDIVIGLREAVVWMENVDGQGHFGPVDTLYTTSLLHHLELSDMDADNDLDLVLISGTPLELLWIANTGAASFGAPYFIASWEEAGLVGALHCDDLTDDGLPEVLVTASGNYIRWFVNGGGSYEVTDSLAHVGGPASRVLLTGDLDLDGDIDQLTINWNGFFSAGLNPGDTGTEWTSQIVSIGGIGPGAFTANTYLLDVDNDGDLDVVSVRNEIWWARNRVVEDGVWGAYDAVQVEATAFSYGVDWVGALGCGPAVSILWHSWPWAGPANMVTYDTALGTFGPAMVLTDSTRSVHLSAADLNGDQAKDLVFAHRDSSEVWWFPRQLPTVTLEYDVLCSNGPVFELSNEGTPLGGTYTLNGSPDAITELDPAALTDPSYELSYSYTDTLTGCVSSATSSFSVEICVGLTDRVEALDIRVYPNPSSNGTIRITTASLADLQLFDASGRVVWQQAKVRAGTFVDVSGLATGVYQVMLRNEKGVGSVRVVVE